MTNQTETIIEEDDIVEAEQLRPTSGPPQQSLIQRAELVPVSQTGAQPQNLAQQVDYAQYMAKAVSALPVHLRNNVGDCLAVIDIASRAGLSPYMVANKTYVQNNRLCFESQLFHALLVQSNLTIGDLTVEYEGEGQDRVCIVTGILRSDRKPRTHRSPPLKQVHPGHSTKTIDGIEKEFVKGSPLWDKKPDVQLFYDTSRDWTRLYAPTATLGILTPEEMIETPLGEEGAIVVENVTSDLHSRLKGVDRTEGHQPGFAEKELAHVAGGNKQIQPAQIPPHKKRSERRKERLAKTAPASTTTKDTPANADAKTAEPADKPAETENPQPTAEPQKITEPKTAEEYELYAARWIENTADPDDIAARWDGEHEMRDALVVRITIRKRLQDKLQERCQKLRDQQ